MSELLIDRPERWLCVLTMNRPQQLNAFTYTMLREMNDAFDRLDEETDTTVVVLTGAEGGFCSGLDLRDPGERPHVTRGVGRVQSRMLDQKHAWNKLVPRMRRLRQPIIAAVDGPAMGLGLVLAAGAELRVAGPNASFGDSFTKIGLSGGELGLSWLLPRLIGSSPAIELMLTGRTIGAHEATAIGLVNRLVEGPALDGAIALAREVNANSPFGTWMTKEVVWSNLEIPSLLAAIDLETRTQVLGLLTEDQREQVQSGFFEKRPPDYRYR